ncbi:MAG: kinetochore-associated Ndc80 complex subunit ndc80 [Watsoniomyces obsoletus]|nr:MAG: kinetochore-associated Ndc80 complex subunit ndc80 [Watsoniomyces obsoletus]
MYLDIQKQLNFEELSEKEVKGRWKSFIGKWLTLVRNRGELAEGWYDPVTKQKADSSPSGPSPERPSQRRRSSPEYDAEVPMRDYKEEEGENSDDDSIGPSLPGTRGGIGRGPGPTIPSLQDLELQREMVVEDEFIAKDELRQMRKLDRKEQKERLDELVPRAEAGTRERQLEKKREVNEKMRSFREKSPGVGDEVGEKDLMGDDGIDAYRVKKKEHERKKNERELRKEEILRARAVEREERLRIHRAKEEKTIGMLKALAKQNFG